MENKKLGNASFLNLLKYNSVFLLLNIFLSYIKTIIINLLGSDSTNVKKKVQYRFMQKFYH